VKGDCVPKTKLCEVVGGGGEERLKGKINVNGGFI